VESNEWLEEELMVRRLSSPIYYFISLCNCF